MCYCLGPIGGFLAIFLSIVAALADFKRIYPVDAYRSWGIRRSKL